MAKKKSGTVLRYNRWGYIFLIPFVVVFIIFQLIPLISTIYNSFFEHYFKNGLTEVGPTFIGIQNYATLFSSGDHVDHRIYSTDPPFITSWCLVLRSEPEIKTSAVL